MAWTIDGVRIFVQEESQDEKQIIARLQPLADNTVLHIFGYEDPIIKINGYVVGTGDAQLIKNMSKDGTRHSLSYPESYLFGMYYVNSVSTKRTKSVFQTLRTDLDCESPVYIVDVEFYQ